MKFSCQMGRSTKQDLSKTQKQQGRTTIAVFISGPHPCTGESREGDKCFFCPEILIYIQFSLQLAEKCLILGCQVQLTTLSTSCCFTESTYLQKQMLCWKKTDSRAF